ncbi:MAG: SDR family oxidoreductase [Burkholderiales bacterium]|nr:SDR family oxidoreductase [Burkholderiales bacterium]
MRQTILGASGYIGSQLKAHLESLGHEVYCPARGDEAVFLQDLGQVYYCVGMTADFRSKPLQTIDAHISLLARVLKEARFRGLLYLSTTRVYLGAGHGGEDGALQVNPNQADDLYNLSKLTGESLCRAFADRQVRVARLSNVLGGSRRSPSFVDSLLDDIRSKGKIVLRSTLDSAKDYIALDDVVPLLPRIAQEGNHAIYNVASGVNVSNAALLEMLAQRYRFTYEVDPAASRVVFPEIDVSRIEQAFGARARPLAEIAFGE